MDRYHDSQLEQHLQETYHSGWSVISEWKLYLWYDVQRLNKNFWRDIWERWEEIIKATKDKPRIMAYRSREKVLFVRFDGEEVSNDKKLTPVDLLAEHPHDPNSYR